MAQLTKPPVDLYKSAGAGPTELLGLNGASQPKTNRAVMAGTKSYTTYFDLVVLKKA